MAMSKFDQFIVLHGSKFLIENLPTVEAKLKELSDSELTFLLAQNYKDPGTMFCISIFLGSLGIDRFMLSMATDNPVSKRHQIKLAAIKLILCLLSFFTLSLIVIIVDLFYIGKATKAINFEKFIKDIEVLKNK